MSGNKHIRFVLEVEKENGQRDYVLFWPNAYQSSGMPEPALTSYIELAFQTSTYFEIKMFEAFVRGTRNFVNNYKYKIKAYLLNAETISLDVLMLRGIVKYENVSYSDILTEEQEVQINDKYEETFEKYKHIKRFGMEEIKDKAFDDELNKAEERVEDEKVDKTPLPPHKEKKEKEVDDEQD